jgi:hypothetical protein
MNDAAPFFYTDNQFQSHSFEAVLIYPLLEPDRPRPLK